MKRSVALKFLAILLCTLSLLSALVSGGGLLAIAVLGLSGAEGEENPYYAQVREDWADTADALARRYASKVLGNAPEELVDQVMPAVPQIDYAIFDEAGTLVEGIALGKDNSRVFEYSVSSCWYVQVQPDVPVTLSLPESSDNSENEEIETVKVSRGDATHFYQVKWCDSPGYSVRLFLLPGQGYDETIGNAVDVFWNHRVALIPVTGVSLLVFAALSVYLCCVAGRVSGSSAVVPRGFFRIPLDCYTVLSFAGIFGIGYLFVLVLSHLLTRTSSGYTREILAVLGYGGFFACLLFVLWGYTAVMQFKAPKHFWLRNSLLGRLWGGSVRLVRILACGALRLFSLLPQVWQWLAVGAMLLALLLIAIAIRSPVAIVTAVILYLGVFTYGAVCFSKLLSSARRMRSGELNARVDDRGMIGSFQELARELSSLAGVVMVAAQKQLKSERMKAELITNVSHDIKTPLTSIINYVDLLQRPHTPEEEQTYLEVLSRQSHRMKKLIEDLMELSKASTGNMNVEIITLDAVEAVNQALGEFSDKLDAAQLTPVFHHPENPVMMRCDGKLFWRAISNLLGNAVKYALPGTRLYIELDRGGENVLISLKNISKAQMNARGDELLERFVRGDSSRNTEGSGLGLNIAQSLLELQGGKLQLLVDGDLFKVTMVLPGG